MVSLIAGCSQGPNLPFEPEIDSSISSPPVPTSAATDTSTVTASPTATITASITPLPTLPAPEAVSRISEFFETNRGCELPCWWGISPGETTWAEAKQFLETFSIYVLRVENPLYPDEVTGSYFEAKIPVPPAMREISGPFPVRDYLLQNFFVRGNRVQIIKTESKISLGDFLSQHGKPGDIWLRSLPAGLGDYLPLIMVLYYADQGIAAQFWDPSSVLEGGLTTGCFESDAKLFLWSESESISRNDTGVFALEWYPSPSFEEATGQTIDEFYDGAASSDGEICLSTPAEIWREE